MPEGGGAAVTSLSGAAGEEEPDSEDSEDSEEASHLIRGFDLRSPHRLGDTQNTPHPSSSIPDLNSSGPPAVGSWREDQRSLGLLCA